jgi:Flp pilus assembly protein TadB
MKYLKILIGLLLVLGFQDLQAVSVPSNIWNVSSDVSGHAPIKSTSKNQRKLKDTQKRKRFKNFLKFNKIRKGLKRSSEHNLRDILIILVLVILLLIVLTLLDGLTRGLISALLLIAIVVVVALWLLGKI